MGSRGSSWDGMCEQIRGCRNCSLGKDDPAPIPPRVDSRYWELDPVHNSLLILGEAPGKVEAQQGEVFRGPAGRLAASWVGGLVDTLAETRRARTRLLEADPVTQNPVPVERVKAIQAAGIPPTVVWGNVVSCYPERTPTHVEVKACWPNVQRVWRETKPTRLLLFGGIAISPWLDFRIGEMAGRWVELPFDGGYTWGFCTWHPAAALRNVELQEKVRRHLGRMASTFDVPAPTAGCVCGAMDFEDHWWRVVPGRMMVEDQNHGSVNLCEGCHVKLKARYKKEADRVKRLEKKMGKRKTGDGQGSLL